MSDYTATEQPRDPAAAAEAPDAGAGTDTPEPTDTALPAGLLQEAKRLQQALGGLAHDHLTLAALETRQAGEALVRILCLAMVSAALLFSVWLGLLAAMIVLLVQQSLLALSSAFLLAALLNGLAVILLIPVIRRQSRKLVMSATINSLQAEADAVSHPRRPP